MNNLTTDEFIHHIEINAKTPLEIEAAKRLQEVDDLTNVLKTAQDRIETIYGIFDELFESVDTGIDTILNVLPDHINDNVAELLTKLQSNMDGEREKTKTEYELLEFIE